MEVNATARPRLVLSPAVVFSIVGFILIGSLLYLPALFRSITSIWVALFVLVPLGGVLVMVGEHLRQRKLRGNINLIAHILGLRFVDDRASRITAAQRLVRTSFLPVIPSDSHGRLFDPFKWFLTGDIGGLDVAVLEVEDRVGVATTVAANFPLLCVRREDVLDGFARLVGLQDIDTEWHTFNATFRVTSQDRKFALIFLDSTLMRWLYEMRSKIEGLDVRGPVVLLHWRGSLSSMRPDGVRERAEMLAALTGLVPKIALERHPARKIGVGDYLRGLEHPSL